MNKTEIYEQIAEELVKKPLSTFRGKMSCVKCVREIVQMYEAEIHRRNMIEQPLYRKGVKYVYPKR